MADTAAWLVDRVIPDGVPVRQWVLSLPYRLRLVCAYEADACALVRGLLVRVVSGMYERRARRLGLPRPRTGAVAFVQRFDSGLRLNVHFHVLWLDGVYAHEPGRGVVEWREHEELRDADVLRLVWRVRARVVTALRRVGKWWDADADDAAGAEDAGDGEQQVLLELGSGAVAGPRGARAKEVCEDRRATVGMTGQRGWDAHASLGRSNGDGERGHSAQVRGRRRRAGRAWHAGGAVREGTRWVRTTAASRCTPGCGSRQGTGGGSSTCAAMRGGRRSRARGCRCLGRAGGVRAEAAVAGRHHARGDAARGAGRAAADAGAATAAAPGDPPRRAGAGGGRLRVAGQLPLPIPAPRAGGVGRREGRPQGAGAGVLTRRPAAAPARRARAP